MTPVGIIHEIVSKCKNTKFLLQKKTPTKVGVFFEEEEKQGN